VAATPLAKSASESESESLPVISSTGVRLQAGPHPRDMRPPASLLQDQDLDDGVLGLEWDPVAARGLLIPPSLRFAASYGWTLDHFSPRCLAQALIGREQAAAQRARHAQARAVARLSYSARDALGFGAGSGQALPIGTEQPKAVRFAGGVTAAVPPPRLAMPAASFGAMATQQLRGLGPYGLVAGE